MTRVRCVLRFAALDHVEVDTPLDLLTESDLAAALDRVQVRDFARESLRDCRLAYQRPGARAAAAMVATGLGWR